MEVKRGDIAICGIGTLGLILKDGMQTVIYDNGQGGTAYVGIHLTDKVCEVGGEWSSRSPVIVGHIDHIETFIQHLKHD